ncbi:MAG TPA: PqqD family peptide modification chaperone [Candidatus Desulfovibrio intestinavium]|uniref:PqqD family peptide modification chaperone n=1 Tax=Candidatus Desulfovibrio intestinavium TaxID=2838534 RepID=A0A9D2KRE2_9BACT|nr:PqqD family peptide modification chaperone [Candidatus Desulfovibrio intestinavium]
MPEPGALDLLFSGVPDAVRVLSGSRPAADTVAVLQRVLAAWPHDCRPVDAPEGPGAPRARFLVEPLEGGTFRLHGVSPEATDFSPFRPGDPAALCPPGYSHEPSLTCLATTLAIELVAVHERLASGQMGLHAAAAVHAGQTLLFCGRHRAGKSLLMARLLLAGWQALGDDMLGLTPEGELFSYGLAPRLRLPLPPCPALAPLLAEDSPLAACRDDRYLCCDPLTLPQLPWGTRRALNAVMVLDRLDEHSSRQGGIFVQPHQADMREVLRRFLLRDGRAGLALQTVDRLLHRVPCRLLRYRTPDEALCLLNDWTAARERGQPPTDPPLEAPAGHDVLMPGTAPLPRGENARRRAPCRRLARRMPAPAQPPDSAREPVRYRQRPGVIFRQDESGAFLARDEARSGRDGKIFLLNHMGCVLWQLWQEAADEAELAALLAEAFPRTPAQRIRRDVAALRRRLCAAGLLQEVE